MKIEIGMTAIVANPSNKSSLLGLQPGTNVRVCGQFDGPGTFVVEDISNGQRYPLRAAELGPVPTPAERLAAAAADLKSCVDDFHIARSNLQDCAARLRDAEKTFEDLRNQVSRSAVLDACGGELPSTETSFIFGAGGALRVSANGLVTDFSSGGEAIVPKVRG